MPRWAVPLILQAIGQIAFVLSGTAEAQETESILKDFFGQEGSRMSYQNSLVMEEDGEVVGVAIFYDGAKARELDEPLSSDFVMQSGILRRIMSRVQFQFIKPVQAAEQKVSWERTLKDNLAGRVQGP